MPEIRSPLAASYPVGRHPGATAEPGIRMREITGWDLVQAACWHGRHNALHTLLEDRLGIAPPSAGRCVVGDGVEVLAAAPGRFWCIAAAGSDRLAALTTAIDIDTGCATALGHSHVRLRLDGPDVRRLLAREIAIDFGPDAFPSDTAARTLLHHVPVTLQCIDADAGVFDLYLPHTFAASAWDYLLDLALPLVYEIAPRAQYGGE